MKAIFELISII